MTNEISVTRVTVDASQDVVSDELYASILASLVEVEHMSFQQIADATGIYSKAWWRFRYKGERPLDADGKNALRRLSGEFPAQPPSIESVTETLIHPDAAMFLVGTLPDGEQVRRVVMLAEPGAVTVRANGTVIAERVERPTAGVDTQSGTAAGQNAVAGHTASHGAKRQPVYRPVLSLELKARIEAAGVSVEELIEQALNAMEETE